MRAELQTGFVVLEDLMLLKLWKSSRPRNARRRAFDFRFLARFRKDTCGGVLIYIAFMLPVLLGVSGLAVDASLWYGNKRKLQAIADTTALSAAFEFVRIEDEALAKTAATADATSNGYDAAEGDVLVINYPPTSGPLTGSNTAFEVIVSRPVPTFLARLVYPDQVTVVARAVAITNGGSDACMYALNPTQNAAIKVSGSATLNLPCGIMSNSDSQSESLGVDGNACINATSVRAAGAITGNCINPDGVENVGQVQDPFYNMMPPTGYGGCASNAPITVGGNETVTLAPGVYCGKINVKGGSTLNLEEGLFVLDGAGLSVAAGATINGTDVSIYIWVSNETASANSPSTSAATERPRRQSAPIAKLRHAFGRRRRWARSPPTESRSKPSDSGTPTRPHCCSCAVWEPR